MTTVSDASSYAEDIGLTSPADDESVAMTSHETGRPWQSQHQSRPASDSSYRQQRQLQAPRTGCAQSPKVQMVKLLQKTKSPFDEKQRQRRHLPIEAHVDIRHGVFSPELVPLADFNEFNSEGTGGGMSDSEDGSDDGQGGSGVRPANCRSGGRVHQGGGEGSSGGSGGGLWPLSVRPRVPLGLGRTPPVTSPSSDEAHSPTAGGADFTATYRTKMANRKRKRRSRAAGGGAASKATAMNGPVVGTADAEENHVIDMNGNGMSKARRWLERPRIVSYEDLERTFAGNYDQSDDSDSASQGDYDMLEFAGRYYNVQVLGTVTSTLHKTVNMVRRRSLSDVVPLEELLKYTKNSTIPNSHVHLLDPEDVPLSCSIFKDLCKYSKGEIKNETAQSVIHGIITYGIERIELRDEIFCQLIRLTNGNNSPQACLRIWSAMCLCAVSFSPSRTLKKYLCSYLRQHCDYPAHEPGPEPSYSAKVAKYAEYCLRLLSVHRESARKRPPSQAETEAVCNLQPMVYRIYFLDGTTKGIALDPLDTSEDALAKIQEKIGLTSMHGWALYESIPDHDRYIRRTEYMADILADWEERQHQAWALSLVNVFRKNKGQGSNPSTPKKGDECLAKIPAENYGKLIMCKRLCQRVGDMIDDPVESHLLYAQAVHYVVHLDEFVSPTSTSLHLAGLQAQVEFGDFDETKLTRYDEVEDFLCQRVRVMRDCRDWSRDIANAHKRYGKAKTSREAETKYLDIVSQFQLYGCTKIFAHYRGVWPYGSETILAINYDGIKFISIQEKKIIFDLYYNEIEEIILEEKYDECHVILTLQSCVSQSRQKCFMFECLELEDFACLIENYSPEQATWTKSCRSWRTKKFKPPDDCLKLYDDLLNTRRALICSGIMQRPSLDGKGLFRSAINRFRGVNCSGRHDDEEDVAHASFWSFNKAPFKSSLMAFNSHEMEDVSARMFNSTLVYVGLESAAVLETDLIVVVQTLITKCMDNEDLCNEFYLQLIKMTTDTHVSKEHQELTQRVVVRYWYLMTMATCVMLPPNELVFSYLNFHLRRYAMQSKTEEGKYALFCIKSLYRTYEKKGRKCPPSFTEIKFVTNRQPIEARVYLADAHAMLIEFDSAATAQEVMRTVKAKAGMRLDSEGYALYQVLGERELYIAPEDKLADALYSWERWCKNNNPACRDLKLIFKKRLFIDPYYNRHDPVEVDLLYHQSVTDVFEQKIPLTKSDAVRLCALRAQTEHGDYRDTSSFDYSSVMRILPRHLRDLIQVSEICCIHKTLAGKSPVASNITFLDVLQLWPIFGATMFEVTQTTIDTLPKTLWLAISQMGVHLTEIKGPEIYLTYTFDEIAECSPTMKNLTLIIGQHSEGPGYLFYTSQADQIVQLIAAYREVLTRRTRRKTLREMSCAAVDEEISEPLHPSSCEISEPLHPSSCEISEPHHPSSYEISEPLHPSSYEISEPHHPSSYEISEPHHPSSCEISEPLHPSSYEISEPHHPSSYEISEPHHPSSYEISEPLHLSSYEISEPHHPSSYEISEPLRLSSCDISEALHPSSYGSNDTSS